MSSFPFRCITLTEDFNSVINSISKDNLMAFSNSTKIVLQSYISEDEFSFVLNSI